jgi:hypothetical protein
MNKLTKWICGAIAVSPVAAQAQVDLTTLDEGMFGARTQVLVLGTTHLSALKDLQPTALDGLLDRLAAFKPEIVTIEREPGDECDLAARQSAKYGADYCASTAAAKAATGLDIPQALTEIATTLRAWPAQSTHSSQATQATPARRRHLAALYLAATESASAYAQWLQLAPAERHAGDGLDAALVQQLDQIAATRNENYLIGARLAARLGLPRVHQVDNHTGDALDLPDVKTLMAPLSAAWAAGGGPALNEQDKRSAPLAHGADLLPLYRLLNQPASLKVFAEANVVGPMQSTSPGRYPQMWVGGWETRNLRIVANIRETFRERPGARVLSIIGVSHKPWLDSWLGMLQGVEIVDAETVLK